MKEEVKRWIEFASEDLKMAELALKESIYNQVCFHSQQCVEKLLKGFIEFRGMVHPHSHRLIDIISSISENPFDDIKDDILLLERFYIPTRYPDALPGSLPEGLPIENDAKEAIRVAKKVFKRIKKEVGM